MSDAESECMQVYLTDRVVLARAIDRQKSEVCSVGGEMKDKRKEIVGEVFALWAWSVEKRRDHNRVFES